ncbi:MAG: cysteine hydrolase [Clostridium sp.]|nr:cysteine hydrolase [Clostridium sp.]MCM1209715.1 cysteine hydrolase [Ruminococcus sp.]
MVLLVVDTQKGIMDDRLYAFEQVRKNINLLISEARKNNIEVVFVRHDDGPGTGFSKGDDDFEIFSEFEPLEGEKIFDKTVNSALHKMTGLTDYLDDKGIKSIMVAGLQTDFCIDATIKSGFDHGYNMIIPEYSNSTFDNCFFDKETAYKYFNELIWKGRYGETVTIEKAVEMLKNHK